MENNRRTVTEIRNYTRKWTTRVAIYCRVSTVHPEQELSLVNQVSHFKEMVHNHIDWELVDTYVDMKSGKSAAGRPEFQRMLADCRARKIDRIETKSISRFGRNTTDTLAVINELRSKGVTIHFENENIDTSETSSDFLISILEAYAQAESEARSHNIKWGITHGMKNGTSKLYSRRCYGYRQGPDGDLLINEQEAEIVRMIFSLYLEGYSIVGLAKELERQGIPSPTGKKRWSKRTIETILINEKYIGNVIVGKTYSLDFPNNKRLPNREKLEKYSVASAHPAIITEEQFTLVMAERQRRSNIRTDEAGAVKRHTSHYSMKKRLKSIDV